MVRIIFGGLVVVGLATALSGCVIENCEEGANCTDDAGSANGPGKGHADETEQCMGYCDRLSVCGAPQAADFDACVKACEVRFEKLPEQTADLCACIVRSRCEDAVEGRCSGGGAGGSSSSGGSSASGGTAGKGGTSSSGGASGSGGGTSTGGAPSTGGTSSSGGSSSTGGSHAVGGSSNGGSSGSSAGSGAGGSAAGAPCTAGAAGDPGEAGGANGEAPPLSCTCDCDCLAPQTCVEGYCTG